jgi:hypothetical protein
MIDSAAAGKGPGRADPGQARPALARVQMIQVWWHRLNDGHAASGPGAWRPAWALQLEVPIKPDSEFDPPAT